MKFNFWGYDSQTMLDLDLTFDDLAFIQWFRDYRDTGKMETMETAEGVGYYVNYSKLIADIPQLFKRATGNETEVELAKLYNTNRAKANRMLKGGLSKLFRRYEKKEMGKTKIFLVLNIDVFTALINNGKEFDGTKINTDATVVKTNIPTNISNLKKTKKKAPSTAPTVKSATQNTDIKFDNTDSIPQVDGNVNTDTKENGIDYDELSLNGIVLLDNGIKVADIKVADKIVANWDGVIMTEAINITLANSKTKSFNYLKKTYDSLVADGGSIESVRDKLLAPVLIPKFTLE